MCLSKYNFDLLPSQIEYDFIETIRKDIESFFAQSFPKSQKFILVLPPLPSKLRFLIHESVPQFYGDKLSTLSIGQNKKRRPILYLKSFIDRQNDSINNLIITQITDLQQKKIQEKKKHKRPDKPLYQPPKSRNSMKNFPNLEDFLTHHYHHQHHNRGMQQEKDYSQPDDNNDDLSWDNLYDDNGDLINDLNNQFETINIKPENVHKSELDYSKFSEKTSTSTDISQKFDDSSHILEIYDISPDLKTKDLTNCLSFNNFKNFEIDWVDDTHALITFQSNLQACEAMNKMFPIMKVRPLGQATNESKQKAKKLKESGVTRKLRPETSAMTARRLVIGALGLNKANIIDPKQRQAEREKLRLAKERKEKTKEAKNIWNDDNIS
ncbi:hypothetical protein HUG17_4531 [Dermatophagoides farinae]|uniref:R3H domain-containing protein n=2 Tax=Dermatophagoides farinae TaxID=6954 RepID=A0A9D4P0P7_DERFA|nr:hypothetical protein HUG17_4531 [Dermatophagoides farinae]